VGATCHPPPSVAPSRNPTRARARAACGAAGLGPARQGHPSAFIGRLRLQPAGSPKTLAAAAFPNPSAPPPSVPSHHRRPASSPLCRRFGAASERRLKVGSTPV
jgi:hypothetical protein